MKHDHNKYFLFITSDHTKQLSNFAKKIRGGVFSRNSASFVLQQLGVVLEKA